MGDVPQCDPVGPALTGLRAAGGVAGWDAGRPAPDPGREGAPPRTPGDVPPAADLAGGRGGAAWRPCRRGRRCRCWRGGRRGGGRPCGACRWQRPSSIHDSRLSSPDFRLTLCVLFLLGLFWARRASRGRRTAPFRSPVRRPPLWIHGGLLSGLLACLWAGFPGGGAVWHYRRIRGASCLKRPAHELGPGSGTPGPGAADGGCRATPPARMP